MRYVAAIMAVLLVGCVVLLFTFGASRRAPHELAIWTQDLAPGRAVLDSLLRQYERERPGVHVQLVYYETEELRSNFIVAALGGSGPDLVYGPSDQVGPFVAMQIIQPLEPFLEQDFLSDFVEQGQVWYEGHLYMLGDRVGNHLMLVYNRDLVPHPPETTDELIALGKRLTQDLDGDGIVDRYGLAWNYVEPFFFIPFLVGYGGWVMDEDGRPTLDTPATVRACQFIYDLKERYRIIAREADLDVVNTLFKMGRAAMVINGPWSWRSYQEAGVNMGLALLPKVSDTGLYAAPMVSATGYCLNVNTRGERLRYALDLLRYLTSTDAQVRLSRALTVVPSRRSAQQHPLVQQNPLLEISQRQIELGRPMPIRPEMRAIWDAMRPYYQLVLSGAMRPEEAARRMQQEAEKKIREMHED
ncbi:MAG: extracellular solute-binding protein [candidate division KSB1 bacterium]|nr:extracellular solute-binding protein [candidate division KSB1 bacterium]